MNRSTRQKWARIPRDGRVGSSDGAPGSALLPGDFSSRWRNAAIGLAALFLLSLALCPARAIAGDPYEGAGGDLLGPAQFAAAVTPSDTANLPTDCKRLWVGGAGNVKLTTVGGSTVTYTAVPAGTYLQVRAQQVFATGTTATNIVAEY